MKSFIVITVLVLTIACAPPVSAEPWTKSVDANLTLTQNAYSDNWVGGEAGALSWAINSNMLAEKQHGTKVNWKNTLKLSFGQIHQQDVETKDWARPVKSTDLIDFEAVCRFTLGWFVDPFMAARVESQFLDASDPENSRYVNPVKFTESFGVAKVLIKEEKREWTLRLGAGIRQFMNRNVADPGTGEKETITSSDGGLTLDSDFTTPLAQEKIVYTSKLTVFQAFFYSEKEEVEGLPNEDYWRAPDIKWENILTASITKYVMVNLRVELLYDKEIDLGGRFKQTLALGLTYKFI